MKKINLKLSLFIYLFLILFVIFTFIPNLKITNIYANKISDNVLEELNKDNKNEHNILIHFQNILDPSKALKKDLIKTLKFNQENSQKNILNFFKNNNIKNYESFYIVNLISCKVNSDSLIELIKYPEIKLIETNNSNIKSLSGTLTPKEYKPNDPNWNIKMIKADKVWDENVYGENVTVGIIDTGIDIEHPALKRKFKGYDKATDSVDYQNSYLDALEGKLKPDVASMDLLHGTHVAGIILGSEYDKVNNIEYNHIGVAPKAKFISARVLDEKKSKLHSNDVFIRAAQWMMNPGGNQNLAPKVINNSWGGGIKDRWFEDMVKTWRAAGILPVFAAGNKPATTPFVKPGSIDVPAAYPDSYAVGAVDSELKLASFSHIGPSIFNPSLIKPEISAPGVNIKSSIPNKQYGFLSGTSMAAPHITGAVALLLSKDNTLTSKQLEKIINETAFSQTDRKFPESPNHGYGYGIVNSYYAYLKLKGEKFNTLNIDIVDSANLPKKGYILIYDENNNLIYQKLAQNFHINLPSKNFKIKIVNKSFEVFEKDILLEKNLNLKIKLKNKALNNFKLKIVDENDNHLPHAKLTLTSDYFKNDYEFDQNGLFNLKTAYGKYDILISESGYKFHRETIIFDENYNQKTITLKRNDFKLDHLIKHNNIPNQNANGLLHIGNTNAQTYFGFEGGAVKFTLTKPSRIENIFINFMQSQLPEYQGNEAYLEILKEDQYKRPIYILKEYKINFTSGMLNSFDLSKLDIILDGTFYILIKTISNQNGGFVVGVDNSKIINNDSFLFNNDSFHPLDSIITQSGPLKGNLMLSANFNSETEKKSLQDQINAPDIELIFLDSFNLKAKLSSDQNYLKIITKNKTLIFKSNQNNLIDYIIFDSFQLGELIKLIELDQNFNESKIVYRYFMPSYKTLDDLILIAENINLKHNISELKLFLDKINNEVSNLKSSYTKDNNTYENVYTLNEKIDTLINDLKLKINKTDPLKIALYNEILVSKEMLKNLKVSESGLDVDDDEFYIREIEKNIFLNKIKTAELNYYNRFDEDQILYATSTLRLVNKDFKLKIKKGLKINEGKKMIKDNLILINQFKNYFYNSNISRYKYNNSYHHFLIFINHLDDIKKIIEIESNLNLYINDLQKLKNDNLLIKKLIAKILSNSILLYEIEFDKYNEINLLNINNINQLIEIENKINSLIVIENESSIINSSHNYFILKENDLKLRTILVNLFFSLILNENNQLKIDEFKIKLKNLIIEK